MGDRYKVIISNKTMYKEIEIAPDLDNFTVGTDVECDIRFRKEFFLTSIHLIFTKSNNIWSVMCSDGLYLTSDSVKKILRKELNHGDDFVVRYQDSNSDVFSINFIIDFDYDKKDYSRQINILNVPQIKISGMADSQILINDKYIGNDVVILVRMANGLVIKDVMTKYGVYVNGVRIDREKEINNYDFFSIVGYSFFYLKGNLYTTVSPNIEVKGLQWRQIQNQTTHFEYPKFIRNTRVSYIVPEEELEIQQPTPKPNKSNKSLLMTIVPSLIMLAMTIVLRGIIGGGGTFVIYSAVSMSLGIITSIITYVSDKKQYKSEWNNRISAYEKYIEQKCEIIEKSRENELRVNRLTYKSLDDDLAVCDTFGRTLFERTVNDMDFLKVYVGVGRAESANQVKYTKQEFVDYEDPLAMIAENKAEQYRFIDNSPIVADLKNSNGIGVVGQKEALYQMLKNMTIDIAIRQFYGNVKLVYILKPEDLQLVSWVRWLHNVENVKLDVRNIICDEESKNTILEYLYVTLTTRESQMEEREVPIDEYYIVFVTDPSAISTHPVSKYSKDCAKYGFTFVYFQEYEENIPQGCNEIIRLDSNSNGGLINTADGDNIAVFNYPIISDAVANQTALKLSGVQVDEIALEGDLTKNITLFELLDIISVDDIDLKKRWGESQVHKSIAVPLGVKSNNQIVKLDISDKAGAHGPHGLVAGTTGSGKSEILQTYILSLATYFHPYEIGFVIIDFKGGGMANQFKDLPHLIGTITNIDGREIDRSLLSIKAELVKRQEMFSASGVNHINDYIKLYKENKVSIPMPHLIMIVDEFAELKSEYPDFMKELISAARIGRTLGVHLILATQKPAGVVDAQIWSNSKFKLCLKVQTREDSNEVIKTPLAAEIVEPGRAYFQVGNNEIFDLFQSAYSGAPIPEGNDANEKIYSIYERNLWGKKTLKYTNKKKNVHRESLTQLQAIVDYVEDYCKYNGIERLPGICLPPLKDIINTKELFYNSDNTYGINVPIGVYDNPEQQQQGQLILEPSRENIYIVGSSQSGKTVLLQTIAYGLIKKYTPSQVNIYMVDCGSMVLKIFEDSFHVGGVVLSNEEEKCKNLFKLLNSIMLDRKKILSEKGIGSFVSYLEAGNNDMPLIVVMIDNMAAFKEYFPNQAEEMNSLTREAQGVGISFVVTSAMSNALNYRTQSNFARKLVLNCNDEGEYSNILGHCKQTPKEVAGRGLCIIDRRILEYQIAIFGESTKEAKRSDELRAFMNNRNGECKEKAVEIPMIPDHLELEKAMAVNPELFRKQGELVIGMDFANVSYQYLNTNNFGALALIGNVQSREKFVKNIINELAMTIVFHNIEIFFVDDKSKSFSQVKNMGFVTEYSDNGEDAIMMISDFCEDIMSRCEDEDVANTTKKMLIINNSDVMKKIYSDKTSSKELSEAIKVAIEANAFILLANVENQAVGFNSSEVLKTVKDMRHAVFFDQLTDNKLLELGGRIKTDTNFDSSMGYWFDGNYYTKIKIFD